MHVRAAKANQKRVRLCSGRDTKNNGAADSGSGDVAVCVPSHIPLPNALTHPLISTINDATAIFFIDLHARTSNTYLVLHNKYGSRNCPEDALTYYSVANLGTSRHALYFPRKNIVMLNSPQTNGGSQLNHKSINRNHVQSDCYFQMLVG